MAQYHRFYAALPERRWVEVSEDEPARLNQLLADLGRELGLDRPLPLPQGLDQAGLTFLGARPLAINGQPVVQLAYRDPAGQLLAVCFMRHARASAQAAEASRNDDLTMIDWGDAAFDYVVIGGQRLDFLGAIARRLQAAYRPT